MNILHIAGGGDVGGAKTHVISLLQTLRKTDNVVLVSLRHGAFSDDAIAAGIHTIVIDSSNYLQIVPKIARIVYNHAIEIVHCHGSKANLAGLLLKRKLHIPVVTTVHSDYRYDYMGSWRKRLTNGLLNTLAIHRLDYRITVSDAFADLLIERKFDPTRIFTIHNSLEFTERDPFVHRAEDDARRAMLARYGLDAPEDVVIVGIAVRFHPVKDVSTLIRAFAEASKADPRLRLLIGGCGIDEQEKQEEARLHDLADSLGLSGVVAFTGWVEDMNAFLNTLDISVLCSLSEGFPYSVLESVRCGAALLCSRVGAIPSIIDHGVNGLLFDPGDTGALCRCMLELSASPEKRHDFAAAQYIKCHANYSLKSMAETQLSIYRVVLRRAARPRKKRYGITVCGAYGFRNAGDEAILASILQDIRSIDPDIPVTVITKTPIDTCKEVRTRAVYTFSLFGVLRALARSSLYINGGGTLMQDKTSTKSLMYYLSTLWLGHLLRTPVLLYGSGIGPITRPRNRLIAGRILNNCTDVITLRDRASVAELESMGVTKPFITLTGDPAISVAPPETKRVHAILYENGLDPAKPYVCVSLREWPEYSDKARGVTAEFLDTLQEKSGIQILFLPMCPPDLALMQKLAGQMCRPSACIARPIDTAETLGILAGASLVLAMRLHALVFAVSQGVPAIGLNYDIKVSSFLEYAKKPYFASLEEMTVPDLFDLLRAALSDQNDAGIRLIRERERKNPAYARLLLERGAKIPHDELAAL